MRILVLNPEVRKLLEENFNLFMLYYREFGTYHPDLDRLDDDNHVEILKKLEIDKLSYVYNRLSHYEQSYQKFLDKKL